MINFSAHSGDQDPSRRQTQDIFFYAFFTNSMNVFDYCLGKAEILVNGLQHDTSNLVTALFQTWTLHFSMMRRSAVYYLS